MPTRPTCPKCAGYLVLHTLDDTTHVITAARCVNCGKVMEPTINAYAALQADGQRKIKRRTRSIVGQGGCRETRPTLDQHL